MRRRWQSNVPPSLDAGDTCKSVRPTKQTLLKATGEKPRLPTRACKLDRINATAVGRALPHRTMQALKPNRSNTKLLTRAEPAQPRRWLRLEANSPSPRRPQSKRLTRGHACQPTRAARNALARRRRLKRSPAAQCERPKRIALMRRHWPIQNLQRSGVGCT